MRGGGSQPARRSQSRGGGAVDYVRGRHHFIRPGKVEKSFTGFIFEAKTQSKAPWLSLYAAPCAGIPQPCLGSSDFALFPGWQDTWGRLVCGERPRRLGFRTHVEMGLGSVKVPVGGIKL